MSRYDILKIEREKALEKLHSDEINRAKWLAKLIDIDEELDEIKPNPKNLQPMATMPRFKRYPRIS